MFGGDLRECLGARLAEAPHEAIRALLGHHPFGLGARLFGVRGLDDGNVELDPQQAGVLRELVDGHGGALQRGTRRDVIAGGIGLGDVLRHGR